MEVQKIECPSCGSNSTFKTSEGEYKCNYCQCNFRVTDEKKSENLNLNDLLAKSKAQKRDISSEETGEIQKRAKRLGLIIVTATLLFVAGIFGFVLTTFQRATHSADGTSVFDDWGKPSRNGYQCFLGSKGPVIFIFNQQSRNKLDSVRYFVKLIDPEKNTTLANKQFGPTLPWKSIFDFGSKFESRFDCFNDIAYCTPKDSGIIGYNIYNFNQIVTSSSLQKQFPELNSGISKANYSNSQGIFKIRTNRAEDFIYDPARNSLSKKQKHEYVVTKDTLVNQLYLTQGNRPQLYLLKHKTKTGYDDMRISEGLGSNYDKNEKWYQGSGRIQNMLKTGDRIFFLAKTLKRVKNGLLILYTEDLSKSSPVVIELLDPEGKTIWQNKDPKLSSLKNNGGSALHTDFQINDKQLVLNFNNQAPVSIGVDLNSGKTSWVYSPTDK